MAVLAALDRLEGDLHLRAVGRFDQVDLDRHGHVAARRGSRAPTGAASPEERVEQICNRAEPVEVGRVASGSQSFVAVAVIGRAPLGVRQDLVGLGRLLELLLGLRVVRVDVRVQLARELTKGLLDLLLGGVALDSEHLVGIARHRG